jgi:hypothetical protein
MTIMAGAVLKIEAMGGLKDLHQPLSLGPHIGALQKSIAWHLFASV